MPEGETRTTEISKSEGRLKVDVGCSHGRKKCLKCAIGSVKDGKGGVNTLKMSNPSAYGRLPKMPMVGSAIPTIGKKKKSKSLKIKKSKGIKMKKISILKNLTRKVKK